MGERRRDMEEALYLVGSNRIAVEHGLLRERAGFQGQQSRISPDACMLDIERAEG